MSLDLFLLEGILRGSRGKTSVKLNVAKLILLGITMCGIPALGQDASTGAIRGTVSDPSGARVQAAQVKATNVATGAERVTETDGEGNFGFQFLAPAHYSLRADTPGLVADIRSRIVVEVGSTIEIKFQLRLAGATQTVTVSEASPLVDTQSSEIANVIDEKAINDLPVNGRRFSDLALLAPGISQDPRGLTSSSNGDLAFGGVRGYQSTMLVDGADNNNSFFAQARGRYRAPYQFSNEVVQEFRVSSNTYGAEIGRSGGGVVNVVTKSGTNQLHGSGFYYIRDSSTSAQHPYTDVKPQDRQHQFGATLGGRVKRNRIFYYAGWDQHIFHVPTEVRFVDGTSVITAQPGDYDFTDKTLVQAAAAKLSQQAGSYRSAMLGDAGFLKVDAALSAMQHLNVRLSTSRYDGTNNVFMDPSSPITTYSVSENGSERVNTETLFVALTSGISKRMSNHLRLQFSNDLQDSKANSEDVRTKVAGVIDAFGRSSILPRRTREHKLHISQTATLETGRQTWKFGSDISQAWISNFFPMLSGGQYIFDDTRVDPWTFKPMTYGMRMTPLRAYAHSVPRYYIQNFGKTISNPDTTEVAGFVQDTIRVTGHLAVNLGLRYDFQGFNTSGLSSNPLYPASGQVPRDKDNFAPRLGFAYSLGDNKPLVIRGGYGIFYTRIPSIYTSTVELDNGLAQNHLFLINSQVEDAAIFPAYPKPMVNCEIDAKQCLAPEVSSSSLTTEIAAFAPDFQIPYVKQASLTVEREVLADTAVAVSYLYVQGEHLIRSRDVNLPTPSINNYPVFSSDGSTFTGDYMQVESFSTWQTARNVACAFPPCINDLQRPIAQLGAIDLFESAATSTYHGLTVSARRRMARGIYFRLGYTFAKSIDDGQDALNTVSTVQNSYDTKAERSLSVTDQRHRLTFGWSAEPRPFHRDRPALRFLFNDWRFSSLMTIGTGRPVNARVAGDLNRDNNDSNDRLPGVSRNAFTGPDYKTMDLRITRTLKATERWRLELMAESFNVFNRNNQRISTSDDGFAGTAGSLALVDNVVENKHYPAKIQLQTGFLKATNAYSPRQVQFSLRAKF
jgi:Carboxypeptidase regulatory-like domain/TonB dependent receptor